MAFEAGIKASAADINALKAAVAQEMDRRQYTNPLNATYGTGTNYDYTVTPVFGGKILKEHQTKIVEPLNAIADTSVTPAVDNLIILGSEMSTLENWLSIWSSVEVNSQTECCTNATCQGLCLTACSSTCGSGCSTGCSSSCTGSCTKSCTRTCGSDGGCTSSCAQSCSSGCQGSCGGGCGNQCIVSAPCRGTCQGQSYT